MNDETKALITGLMEAAKVEAAAGREPDLLVNAARAISAAANAEKARQRDLAHPGLVPESVTDAGFDSQKDWWRPGDDPLQQVIIPALIESVAAAAYHATRAHLAENTE